MKIHRSADELYAIWKMRQNGNPYKIIGKKYHMSDKGVSSLMDKINSMLKGTNPNRHYGVIWSALKHKIQTGQDKYLQRG